jgi:ectoine hydroxylase-related dioxygenase (phytanoyl-CoA dioxygenase family)
MVARQAAVTLEDISRDAMAADFTSDKRQDWIEDALACIREHGAVVVRNAIPKAVIDAVNAEFHVRHDVHMAPGQKKLFRRFQSDPLRAQVPTAVSGPVANPEFFAPPSVVALAHELVGDDFIIGDMGVVISHGGATKQEIHRDSSPLFDGAEMDLDLPMFCLMVLVPLVDVSAEMGPTEYWLGSHRIKDTDAVTANPPIQVPVEAGTVCLHDSRLVHRGGRNEAGPVRPLLYFGFHRNWHFDNDGFDYKPQIRINESMLARLPEEHRRRFRWALHLNRMESASEFARLWTRRIGRAVSGQGYI